MNRLQSECIYCILKRHLKIEDPNVSEETRLAYLQQALGILADAAPDEGAPVLLWKIKAVRDSLFESTDPYAKVKVYYNDKMLHLKEKVEKIVKEAEDPLELAMAYAMVGNYIDFGAMKEVDEAELMRMLNDAKNRRMPKENYRAFCEDLKNGRKLVYLTDNCGEIVMDKVLIDLLKQLYPNLDITVLVRGEPVLNDATMEDAEQVGLTKTVRVIGNGNGVAGTWMPALGKEAREAMEEADVILSKGQGNFETLRGCGKNVYYLFLCKCDLFAGHFGVPKFTGMLLRDEESR